MNSTTRRRSRVATAAAAAVLVAAATAASAAPGTGSAGIGDPYYPEYGNGGYDVTHYKLDLTYTPSSDLLTGTATLTVTPTADLKRFNLDFGLQTSSVTVDGKAARFNQADDHELVVTPKNPVKAGKSLTVVVTYAGVPSATEIDGLRPWVKTADGAVAVGEPEIAAWWFPSNDHPRDKATYDISITVPKGIEAISNGRLVAQRFGRSADTWRWRETKPMAPYLLFMAVGQFDVTSGTTEDGKTWVNAVASNGGSEGEYAAADLARTPEVLAWESRQWGPYPYNEMGGVAPAADFGFALENQTRPVYTRGFWRNGPNIYVVVHEQAHQWYGDSVSVQNWRDIWLNEGFASFTEWLWSEGHGEGTGEELLAAYYNGIPASSSFWSLRIGDPGKGREFSGAVYDRGAMTLQALRHRIGDPAFFQLMRNWARNHRYGNGEITQFIDLAERLTGEDLGSFFQNWLYTGSKPEATAENGLDGVTAAAASARTAPPKSKTKIDHVHAVAAGQEANRETNR